MLVLYYINIWLHFINLLNYKENNNSIVFSVRYGRHLRPWVKESSILIIHASLPSAASVLNNNIYGRSRRIQLWWKQRAKWPSVAEVAVKVLKQVWIFRESNLAGIVLQIRGNRNVSLSFVKCLELLSGLLYSVVGRSLSSVRLAFRKRNLTLSQSVKKILNI